MSLVKSEVPNNCIAAGVPAHITRKDIENDLPPVKAHDIWRGKLPGNRDGHIIAARLEQPKFCTTDGVLRHLTIRSVSASVMGRSVTAVPVRTGRVGVFMGLPRCLGQTARADMESAPTVRGAMLA